MTKEPPEFASFDQRLDVDRLSREPEMVHLRASDADLKAVATTLKIPAIQVLAGEAKVTRHGDLIEVTGHLAAKLARECVATLEPMEETIDEDFFVTFTLAQTVETSAEEVEADLDAPEPLEGDALSMGDVFIEQLVLAMDPHPRKPDAAAIEDPGAGATVSPFAVLERLKNQD